MCRNAHCAQKTIFKNDSNAVFAGQLCSRSEASKITSLKNTQYIYLANQLLPIQGNVQKITVLVIFQFYLSVFVYQNLLSVLGTSSVPIMPIRDFAPPLERTTSEASNENEPVLAIAHENVAEDTVEKVTLAYFQERLLLMSSRIFGQMNISMDAAEGIMKNISEVVELTTSFCKSKTDEHAATYGKDVQDHFKKMTCCTKSILSKVAKKFNTEQKMKSVLSKKNALFLPSTKVFAENDEQVGDDLISRQCKATILPIESQIKQFLGRNDNLKRILANQTHLESQTSITSFLTGNRWNGIKEKFVGKKVIPVFLFNDDYGPDDGLSPHTSPNKISGYYYSFPTLPIEMLSSIDSIFVAMLAKTLDIKRVGPNTMLRMLVAEFKPLEETGIQINGETIFITPVLICGDNLGLNYNLGIHGFRGTYFCRMCYMVRARTETCCNEDESLLRTEEHYQACLNALERGDESFGVLFRTNLNNLKSFRFSQSLVADIMHDLLSGVCVYGVMEILKKAVRSKKFTLKQFNEVKNRFDYGSKEKHYKIEDIIPSQLTSGKIRAHAREILTLVKYLPAMLSKLLRANSPLRSYACMLNGLVHVCLKNSYTEEDLTKLRLETSRHNREFLRLFNKPDNPRPLPPKAHLILHYARIIKQSGPLKHLWAMRFEAKHQQCKAYAKVCHSRRNLCLSIAKKICYNNAFIMLNKDINYNKVSEIKRSHKQSYLFTNELQTFVSCSSAKYKGKKYCVEDFILSNSLEQAFKILDIAVKESSDQLILVTASYEVSFSQSLRLYKIGENNHVNEIKQIDELEHPPLSSIKFERFLYVHHDEF